MSPTAKPHAGRYTAGGLLVASAGIALLVWLIWSGNADLGEILKGFRQIGWWLALIVALGGLRFAARAGAWVLSIEPPHQMRFTDAFSAVVCGDALGNVTPLGPIVGEPAKVAYVRGQVSVGVALTALAIENVLYTLSVAAMIAAGTIALLYSFNLDAWLRHFSEAALAAIILFFAVAAWTAWRRPALLSRWLSALLPGRFTKLHARLGRLRAIEEEVYTFASRRRTALFTIVVLDLAFHTLGVIEAYVTLWLIRGSPPSLLTSFILETANRLITVAFKFVPFQLGIGEAGSAYLTQLLGLGTAPGLTLSLVRKARMGVWSLVGMALLVRKGLSTQRILEDVELKAPPTSSV